jgi:hypothetical protein
MIANHFRGQRDRIHANGVVRGGKSVPRLPNGAFFDELPVNSAPSIRHNPFFPRTAFASHGVPICEKMLLLRVSMMEKRWSDNNRARLTGRPAPRGQHEVPMISTTFRALVLAGASTVCVLGAVTAANAQSRFDGDWSVVLITRSGPCDQSYRYGLTISNGNVYSASGGAASVSGHVSSNGSVSVNVSGGGRTGSGSGRLSGNSGCGNWRASGPDGGCRGTWHATRG